MVEINLTIVIQVVQFLILVFILNRILFRPISQAIEDGRKRPAPCKRLFEPKLRAMKRNW